MEKKENSTFVNYSYWVAFNFKNDYLKKRTLKNEQNWKERCLEIRDGYVIHTCEWSNQINI